MENNTDQQLRETALKLFPEVLVMNPDAVSQVYDQNADSRETWLKGAIYVYDGIVTRRDLTIVSLTETINKLEGEVERLKASTYTTEQVKDAWNTTFGLHQPDDRETFFRELENQTK